MKIKFLISPKGRPEYQAGETHEFKSDVEVTYARKFLAKGWAEPVDGEASKTIGKIKQDEKDKAAQDAKEKADYAAEVRSGQRGPNAQIGGLLGGAEQPKT